MPTLKKHLGISILLQYLSRFARRFFFYKCELSGFPFFESRNTVLKNSLCKFKTEDQEFVTFLRHCSCFALVSFSTYSSGTSGPAQAQLFEVFVILHDFCAHIMFLTLPRVGGFACLKWLFCLP